MFVGKPRINYICLKKKRKKTADIMLNKTYLSTNSLCLPCMKTKCLLKNLTRTSVLSSPSRPSAVTLKSDR